MEDKIIDDYVVADDGDILSFIVGDLGVFDLKKAEAAVEKNSVVLSLISGVSYGGVILSNVSMKYISRIRKKKSFIIAEVGEKNFKTIVELSIK